MHEKGHVEKNLNYRPYIVNLVRNFRMFNFFLCSRRMRQGREREPSIKTLRSEFCTEFWRHCIMSGGTQRRALPHSPDITYQY